MADPPADGFDFMCEPSGGSLIQLTASVRPREMLVSSHGLVFFLFVSTCFRFTQLALFLV